MIVLAIDTAGETASVAVSDRDGQIYEVTNTDSLDHLRSMIPMTASLLSEHGIDKKELEEVAVSAGPGSFTGIRIGMAAARTLAQVLEIPVAPVMTLDAYLYHDYDAEGPFLLCPMTDARRGNVFAAVYEMPERRKLVPEGLYPLEALIRRLPADRPVIFTGSGAASYADRIQEEMKTFLPSAEARNRQPVQAAAGAAEEAERIENTAGVLPDYRILTECHHAATILKCAEARKAFVNYAEAEPVYLRKSEAEIKRKEGKLGLRARKRQETERQKILEMPPAEEVLQYRVLTENDVAALAELDALCFGKAWKEDAFRGDLCGSRAAYYEGAFSSEGKLIGFAGGVSLLEEGEINRVASHPLYRNRGIAGKCLKRVLDRMTEKDVRSVFLEVREANRSAITLYKNSGFRVISKRKNYYQETGENALIMQWTGEERPE